MSSSTELAQRNRAAPNFIGPFPPEVWRNIFRHLDATSLLVMAEAVPKLKRFAFCSKIVRRVTFDPETDERAIKKFLGATREQLIDDQVEKVPLAVHVRLLRFTNCLALSSEVILNCAGYCYNLRELYCVNCLVEPPKLFDLLSLKLPGVKKLEWSLYEDSYYKSWLDSHAVTHIRTFPKFQGPKINTMYVELVVTQATVFLLDHFLTHCRRLRHLHVHAIRKEPPGVPSAEACRQELSKHKRHLETFKYSCEQVLLPSDQQSRIEERDERHRAFKPEGAIWGNIACRFKPEHSSSLVTFNDIVEQKVILRAVKQAVVVVEADSKATCLFEAAATKPESWKDPTRLSLVLMAPKGMEVPKSPTAHSGYMNPMKQFFSACVSHIVELNLSAYHFTIESDCCSIVASTLCNLRSLALPPCGANHEDSLKFLARGCRLLEQLDVGSDAASSCETCQLPLLFSGCCFERLHRRTRLRRLSIDETAKVVNLRFLLMCQVEELRLSVDSADAEELEHCPWTLGQLLYYNPRLTSLTLLASKETLGPRFALTLCMARSLRHLCVLTATPTPDSAAEEFFMILEARLPKLRSLHAHYMSARNTLQALTWIRQWKPDYSEPTIGKWRSSDGLFLDDSPCLGRQCSVTTFIGLARPRNRF
ncbi:hypothetical protein HPB49_003475 [Dermacentor silvarum]|uniref:Uncharacterized protein n=1 Tax=Dermacentor silvarum TaxID=543639 RepID=A0ACB8DMP2_DERSI|nr:hypothetical protein HPB49_003475 [Dermacentor silvarum]